MSYLLPVWSVDNRPTFLERICLFFLSGFSELHHLHSTLDQRHNPHTLTMAIKFAKQYPYTYVPETKADLDWAERE